MGTPTLFIRRTCRRSQPPSKNFGATPSSSPSKNIINIHIIMVYTSIQPPRPSTSNQLSVTTIEPSTSTQPTTTTTPTNSSPP
ncbi:hypothetical protein HanHA89_Chr14g0592571 [Helianthus annuus]|nr:hypothetical protein HanHA89_Chr14g0592571 [Helianthus annuus]